MGGTYKQKRSSGRKPRHVVIRLSASRGRHKPVHKAMGIRHGPRGFVLDDVGDAASVVLAL